MVFTREAGSRALKSIHFRCKRGELYFMLQTLDASRAVEMLKGSNSLMGNRKTHRISCLTPHGQPIVFKVYEQRDGTLGISDETLAYEHIDDLDDSEPLKSKQWSVHPSDSCPTHCDVVFKQCGGHFPQRSKFLSKDLKEGRPFLLFSKRLSNLKSNNLVSEKKKRSIFTV